MFEPSSLNLAQLASFTLLGFFLGFSYEPLRIIRLFKRQGVIFVAIQDFVFLTFAGIMTFAYALELGSGQFRLFFVAGEIFGAIIYFLTVGKIVSICSELIVKIIKAVFRAIRRFIIYPVIKYMNKTAQFLNRYIVKIYNFVVKLIKNIKNHLKNNVRTRYNIIIASKKHKQINKLIDSTNLQKNPKGLTKNVIKAKVTKKA